MWHVARLALAVLVAAGVETAAAQPRTLYNSDLLPRDLVVAILMTTYNGSEIPDIVVGEIPPLLRPRIFVPSGARVLGTILSFESATVLYESRLEADSLRTLIEPSLPGLGWKPQRDPWNTGGFVSFARRPTTYCGGAEILTFHVIPRVDGATLMSMRVSTAEGSSCDARQSQEARDAAYLRLPRLVNPRDMPEQSQRCHNVSRLSRGSVSAATVLETTASEDSLLAHYGRQLTEAGWSRTPFDPEENVTHAWTRQIFSESEIATLTVTTPKEHPRCKSLMLTLRRIQR